MSFVYVICCVLLLHCVPCRMSVYLKSFLWGCIVSALPFCCVDGCREFRCGRVDGGDYCNGVFDDFVELDHLVLFLRRINLPPT